MHNLRYGLLILFSLIIAAMMALGGYLLWQLLFSPPADAPASALAVATAEPALAKVAQPTLPPTAVALPPATATQPPPPTATALPTAVFSTVTPDLAQPELVATPSLTATETLTSADAVAANGSVTVIGTSREGRPIESYRFGSGPAPLIFVGGMHGGYEWNTILLAYEAIDYFTANPTAVPESISLYIVPSANPDGQYLVTNKVGRFTAADVTTSNTFPGRFNSIGVDLNRNWDCFWSEEAYWRDQPINPGTGPFSEPESQALRDYFLEILPRAVIFWHSAANGTFAAACPDLFEPSWVLAELYGIDAGYPAYEAFSAYEITGDAGDWLSTIGIPSITVELRNRQDTEWEKNLPGMQAVLRFYDTGSVDTGAE